jgi:hypothetical protein
MNLIDLEKEETILAADSRQLFRNINKNKLLYDSL